MGAEGFLKILSPHPYVGSVGVFPKSIVPTVRNQTLNLLQFITNLVLCMCVLFYSSFVCISAYANAYFKTTIIKQNTEIILIAGVPSCQALPGFLLLHRELHLCAFRLYSAR